VLARACVCVVAAEGCEGGGWVGCQLPDEARPALRLRWLGRAARACALARPSAQHHHAPHTPHVPHNPQAKENTKCASRMQVKF
jgi:hypothetical protein